MSETVEAAVPVEAAAPTGSSVIDRLTARFQSMETPPQVDNSSGPEAEAEDPVKKEAPKTDEPAIADEPDKDAEDPDKEPKAEAIDVDADEEKELVSTYPTSADDLKTQWPRAVPLKCIEQAAGWAAEAQHGKEIVTELGGEPYIKPLAKLASALQQEDAPPEAFQPFFEGIVEAAGDDALLKVIAQSIHMGFVQGEAWRASPATKEWGDKLHTLVDAAVQERFNIDTGVIAQLAEWQSIGAIDTLSTWIENDFLDEEEDWDAQKFFEASNKFYNDIRAIQHNPKLKEQTKENLELKRQLEERKADAKNVPEPDFESSFNEYIGNAVDTILPKVIFAETPLQEIETDTPEMKELKADFRDNITDKVKNALAAEKKSLLAGFKQGKQNTAVYQSSFAKALEAAVGKADPNRQRAEKAIAALYGKTRNAKLLEKQDEIKTGTHEAPLTPTQPQRFDPADAPKSVADITKRLADRIAAHDANQ